MQRGKPGKSIVGTVWKLEMSGFKLMVYKINMHLLLGVCTRVYMHIFPSPVH